MNGQECAALIRNKLKEKLQTLNIKPKLVVFQIGNNEASNVYIRNKEKACHQVGILFELKKYDDISEGDLIKEIEICNQSPEISGILVQLPLPEGFDETKITNAIISSKDVDGLSDVNQGLLWNGADGVVSCTPKGVISLLKMNNIDIASKNVTIIGRSNLVGKPLAALFLKENATVTICHSKTIEIEKHTKNADIVVVAIGKPNFLKKNMIKDGAVIIDVGINRTEKGLCGDTDYDNLVTKCSYITPVPGGVGPMTIAMLLENVIECYEKNR